MVAAEVVALQVELTKAGEVLHRLGQLLEVVVAQVEVGQIGQKGELGDTLTLDGVEGKIETF